MRKVLLATAAFAFVGAGSAMAVDSTSLTIQTSVPKACSASFDEETGTVTLPADSGQSVSTDFSFVCNFGGNTATVSFASTNLGVEDETQSLGPHNYNMSSTLGGAGTAATGYTTAAATTVANIGDTETLTLQLVEDIDVAGEYEDVLTITIAAN